MSSGFHKPHSIIKTESIGGCTRNTKRHLRNDKRLNILMLQRVMMRLIQAQNSPETSTPGDELQKDKLPA